VLDEEIDLYAPVEYRILCTARAAQDVLVAGFTALARARSALTRQAGKD
jgi:hypothetical protein